MPETAQELGGYVVALLKRAGFALAGVCDAKPSGRMGAYRQWIDQGKHGEMGYLARNLEVCEDVRLLLDGARSVVMVGDVYEKRGTKAQRHEGTKGRIAKYAQGEDYHLVMKKTLHDVCDQLRERFPGEQFRAFVDTAPVLEREHAARCGLGWIGKHTLLIHPDLGSWMFLGGFVTTLELEPPASQRSVPDHCGTCTRCIDACPTGAISPYSVDATKCISYLTIEHRSAIDPALHEAMGDWIFGCDICQEVCPHNGERHQGSGIRHRSPSPREEYQPRETSFDLLEVLGWTEDDRRAALAKSAMKRAKLDMFRRNALIAIGNACRNDRETSANVRTQLHAIESDEDEPDLVRETARRVFDAKGSSAGDGA